MKKLFIVFSILFLLFALSGMGSTQISITDDRGIEFQFEHPVQRIVSLYTCLLYTSRCV